MQKYEEKIKLYQEKADYFTAIDFPIVAATFADAAATMRELVDVIKNISITSNDEQNSNS